MYPIIILMKVVFRCWISTSRLWILENTPTFFVLCYTPCSMFPISSSTLLPCSSLKKKLTQFIPIKGSAMLYGYQAECSGKLLTNISSFLMLLILRTFDCTVVKFLLGMETKLQHLRLRGVEVRVLVIRQVTIRKSSVSIALRNSKNSQDLGVPDNECRCLIKANVW